MSSSINSMLYSIQNRAPAMLSVGTGKTQNYDNLSELVNSLNGNTNSSSGATNSTNDTVSLTYKNIGSKMMTDMASITAEAINKYPDLDNDYVIAVIDDGKTREARVYRRSEILKNFEGTDAEKAELEKSLAKNPLMVFNNANGLPESSSVNGAKYLDSQLNAFLTSNAKTLDVLSKAGFDAFENMLGNSTMKKILAFYASTPTTSNTTPSGSSNTSSNSSEAASGAASNDSSENADEESEEDTATESA